MLCHHVSAHLPCTNLYEVQLLLLEHPVAHELLGLLPLVTSASIVSAP